VAEPELFENEFHVWLGANGVHWVDKDQPVQWPPHPSPFDAIIDLNALKVGVFQLIDKAEQLGLRYPPHRRRIEGWYAALLGIGLIMALVGTTLDIVGVRHGTNLVFWGGWFMVIGSLMAMPLRVRRKR
jgi:hypothetical protein